MSASQEQGFMNQVKPETPLQRIRFFLGISDSDLQLLALQNPSMYSDMLKAAAIEDLQELHNLNITRIRSMSGLVVR